MAPRAEADREPHRHQEFGLHDSPALPTLLFRINGFSASTWNSSSLLGTLRTTGPKQTATRRYLEQLLDRDAAVALQETHVSAADLDFLPDSRSYLGTFLGDPGGDSRSSGTVLAIHEAPSLEHRRCDRRYTNEDAC